MVVATGALQDSEDSGVRARSSTRGSFSSTRVRIATCSAAGGRRAAWSGLAIQEQSSRSSCRRSHRVWLSGPRRRRDPRQARDVLRPPRLAGVFRFFGHQVLKKSNAARPESRREADPGGGSADPDAVERARRGRRGARAARDQGRGWTTRARGRASARCRERHLVHGLPHRLRLDRPAGVRRGRRAEAGPAEWSNPSRGSTSSDSSSCTRSRPTCCRALAGTPRTWRSTSRRSGNPRQAR